MNMLNVHLQNEQQNPNLHWNTEDCLLGLCQWVYSDLCHQNQWQKSKHLKVALHCLGSGFGSSTSTVSQHHLPLFSCLPTVPLTALPSPVLFKIIQHNILAFRACGRARKPVQLPEMNSPFHRVSKTCFMTYFLHPWAITSACEYDYDLHQTMIWSTQEGDLDCTINVLYQ